LIARYPSRTSSVARTFGRAVSKLTAVNLYTSETNKVTAAMADSVAMDVLQINAPFGQLGADTLKISTFALASGDAANDVVYTVLSNNLLTWTAQRNAIAHEMRALLDGAAFDDELVDEVRGRGLITDAHALLDEVADCANNTTQCAH
jgi:hypothetical protein